MANVFKHWRIRFLLTLKRKVNIQFSSFSTETLFSRIHVYDVVHFSAGNCYFSLLDNRLHTWYGGEKRDT